MFEYVGPKLLHVLESIGDRCRVRVLSCVLNCAEMCTYVYLYKLTACEASDDDCPRMTDL